MGNNAATIRNPYTRVASRVERDSRIYARVQQVCFWCIDTLSQSRLISNVRRENGKINKWSSRRFVHIPLGHCLFAELSQRNAFIACLCYTMYLLACYEETSYDSWIGKLFEFNPGSTVVLISNSCLYKWRQVTIDFYSTTDVIFVMLFRDVISRQLSSIMISKGQRYIKMTAHQ